MWGESGRLGRMGVCGCGRLCVCVCRCVGGVGFLGRMRVCVCVDSWGGSIKIREGECVWRVCVGVACVCVLGYVVCVCV